MSKQLFSLLSIPTLQSIDHAIAKFPFPVDFTGGKYTNIQITIKNSKSEILYNNHDIKNFSFVWLTSQWNNRELAYALELYLKKNKTPHTSVEYSASKISDNLKFAINNLPLPDSIYVHRKNITEHVDAIIETCGLPLIIKDVKGSQGKDSFYIKTKESLLQTIDNLPKGKRFLFQKFIPNEYDWGVMVSHGKVVAGEKSYPAKNEFRNNAINGATEEFVDVSKIPEEIKNIAVTASDILDLSWSRADIIIDKETNKPYLLEVNRYPGITADSDEIDGAYSFLSSHITPIINA